MSDFLRRAESGLGFKKQQEFNLGVVGGGGTGNRGQAVPRCPPYLIPPRHSEYKHSKFP